MMWFKKSVVPVICLLVVVGCSNQSNVPKTKVTVPLFTPTPPPGTVEERVEQAEEFAKTGDYAKAIDTLEEALLIDAKHRTVLLLLVKYAQIQSLAIAKKEPADGFGLMMKAGAYLRMLRAAHHDLTEEEKQLVAEVLFNEACANARSVRLEETLGSLREAVAAGFKDFHRITEDADWAAMRELPQFQKALKELMPKAASESEPDRKSVV